MDYVVVVDLSIDDDTLPEFMRLMRANAQASLAHEPGCRRFDICVDAADPTQLMLYEIYDDAPRLCRPSSLGPLPALRRRHPSHDSQQDRP